MKEFCKEHTYNEEYIKAHLESMEKHRLMIEDTIDRARCSNNRIRVTKTAIGKYIDKLSVLCNYFNWLPSNERK